MTNTTNKAADYEQWLAAQGVPVAPAPVEVPAFLRAAGPAGPVTGRLPTDDKARKALPLWTFLMEYFPDSFRAVAEVAVVGDKQHGGDGQKIRWQRGKSPDQMNCAFRHMWDHGRGTVKDIDGCYHLAKAIWRLSAELQLLIEKEERANDN